MSAETPRRPTPRPTPRTGVIVVAAIVLAIVIWLIVRGGDDNDSKQTAQPVPQRPGLPAVSLDKDSLKNYASGQSQPVYWVGPRPQRKYEVTRTGDGSTYIRYLPPGVKAGDKRPAYLTVGSYPNNNPLNAVREAGSKKGSSVAKVPAGGEAVISGTSSNSVYLAYPNSKVLVEVWDPKPGRSAELVRSGAVVRVR